MLIARAEYLCTSISYVTDSNTMPPGNTLDEKPYASCEIVPKPKNRNWSEEAIRRINDKYDNYKYNSGSLTGSDSMSGSSVDTSELTEEERLKIDICFRGLKTQVSICCRIRNKERCCCVNEAFRPSCV